MLHVFDTATREKIPFEPLEAGRVHMYSCGPTVWDYAHIGNFRSFLFADVLKRYLRYSGFDVLHVMNLTDIDDRIASRVREAGISLREYTDPYIEAFIDDLQSLNIDRADVYARATDHIDEMVALIQQLESKGLAYRRDGSVYFSIAKFPDYGAFARLDLSGLRDGARVDSDVYDKDDVRDFVLWKAWSDADGDVFWDSPFGRGRPGWHVECSAMSTKYLGEVFDIHTGGIDLIFPHHQNEIAQSCGASGHSFVKYWMHNEFMNIDGQGMSKSLGNNVRLQAVGEGAADIRALRYLVVTSHYRTILNFTNEALGASRRALERLSRLRRRVLEGGEPAGATAESSIEWSARVEQARTGFRDGMDDDLNSPKAMAAVFGMVNEAEKRLGQEQSPADQRLTAGFLDEIDRVLGLFYTLEGEESADASRQLAPDLAELLAVRARARLEKDWDLADRLRGELEEKGVVVSDTPAGTEWSWK